MSHRIRAGSNGEGENDNCVLVHTVVVIADWVKMERRGSDVEGTMKSGQTEDIFRV
jgi:hypothetical protein